MKKQTGGSSSYLSNPSNMKKQRDFIENIQDVYDAAGSTSKLAYALGVHQVTVEGWRRAGIPLKYWDRLFKLYMITPAELYSVSQKCRKAITNPSKCSRR